MTMPRALIQSSLATVLISACILAQAPAQVATGVLPKEWLPGGPDCANVAAFQVHEYNAGFFILRQSGCSHFEKPFLYLVFGREKVMLVDTGAGKADVAGVVTRVIADRQTKHKEASPPLVVVHTHAHSDHTAGDAQLTNIPRTTVVAPGLDAVKAFFNIANWPEQVVQYDLGGRTLDVIPIPGHDSTSIALYDRQTGVLLTGDTVYPGRLYVRDAAAFEASIRRLVDFTRDKQVTHVLGNHIENSRTPYIDFPEGTRYQPDEHALELGRAHLLEIDDALRRMKGKIIRRALRDVTIWPVARQP
jgi:hydroxyacylglutathione hydrolase